MPVIEKKNLPFSLSMVDSSKTNALRYFIKHTLKIQLKI